MIKVFILNENCNFLQEKIYSKKKEKKAVKEIASCYFLRPIYLQGMYSLNRRGSVMSVTSNQVRGLLLDKLQI